MFDIIASSLFQKKTCRLPGIGKLELVSTPAEYDFPNRQIKAPGQTILFVSSSSAEGFNEFSAISSMMKDELKRKGRVEVTGLGIFTTDENEEIQFEPVSVPSELLQPVKAEKVIHKDAAHSILVGDKETTNVEMNEYYSEGENAGSKNKWYIWAAAAALAGIALIAFYCYQNGFNGLASLSSF